jgi:response regulator NasT
MESQPRIAVVDRNPVRAAIIADGLREAGCADITLIEDTSRLLERLNALAPDVIIIDIESPSRDVLEQMFHVSRTVQRPVAMFVDQSDSAMINAAIDAGVSAYIVDGLRKERVKAILDMAISRFNAFAKLKAELESAKSQIEDRKVIDRAKSILMKAKNIPEPQAYALMRQAAMNESKKIADIARSILTAAELLR